MNEFAVMFIRVASIFLMILAGFTARRRGILTAESTRSVSSMMMDYVYPPMIFASLTGGYTFREVMKSWSYPVSELLMMLIGFVVSGLVVRFFRGRSDGERRIFHYQCTLNNFMFLPLPLVLQLFGAKGAAILSLAYVGGEIGVWTLGVVAIKGGFSLKELRKVFCTPMIAIILAVAVLLLVDLFSGLAPAEGSLWKTAFQGVMTACQGLGGCTVGLSMIVAGSNMATLKMSRIYEPFHLTLAFLRLLLIPALSLLAMRLLPIPEEGRLVCYLVALMPCSVGSVAYSSYFNADVETAATAVLTTHIGCLLTIPLWMAWLM